VSTTKKSSKTYKRSDTIIFLETAEKLGLSQGQLSQELGYSDHAASEWVKAGEMPAVAALACEALLRRRGQQDSFVIVTTVEGGRVTESRCVQSPGRMELSGQTYMLVPVKKG
jgi:hypothetical protein